MEKSVLISLIVLTYNCKAQIANCVKSISNLDYNNFELIMVDNNSTDGTRQLLADLKIDKSIPVKIILNSTNLGYNLGNLAGIQNSKGDIIAIINPDVILEKTWLKNMMDYLQENPKRVIVGGKLLNSDKTVQSMGGLLDIYGATILRKTNENNQKFFYHPGSAFVFKKKILKQINLDPNLFMYYDDVDLAWQTRLLGYQIDYCENACAVHKQNTSWSVVPISKFYNISKNRIYICLKNYSLNRRIRRIPKIIFFVFSDSIYYSVKSKSPKYFLTFFKIIGWNLANFNKMKKERKKIQKFRKVSDNEIEKFMLKKSIELQVLRS